jgi:prepilin-type processing-associated H-X9-DG protein
MPFPPAVGLTNYLAVVGEPCAMNGTAEGLRFAQFTDGTAQTMVLVEADVDQAVEWTKPADWEFDANNPQRGLGGLRPGGWNAAFADGHVTFISKSIDPQVLKALFTRNGREVVNQW